MPSDRPGRATAHGVVRSENRQVIAIGTSTDVVTVRQAVRAMATSIGLSLVEQTKIVTAASELARNALEHGKGGQATIDHVADARGGRGIRLIVEDHGPGIPDVQLALTDGYTTGTGMGLGLSGSRRLVDDFDIWSAVGQGTRVTVVRWK